MKKLALSLAVLLAGLSSSVTPARADSVDIGYLMQVQAKVPALALALGTFTGTAVVRYSNATVGGHSQVGSAFAFTPVHGPARVLGATFAGPVSFTALGDLLTGFIAGGFNAGPGPNVLLSGGTLQLGILGGASGTIHCTGATCSVLGFVPSVVNPFGFPIAGVISAAGADPAVATAFTFAPTTIGTFAGQAITGVINFVEAPILGPGASRHLIPEPTTAALLGVSLLGLAGLARRRRR